MGGIVASLRPIYTSPININTFYTIVKIIVADFFKTKSMYSIIATYIIPIIIMVTISYSFITMDIVFN